MMEYVESPKNHIRTSSRKAVFLAGGITDCPDWQSELTGLMKDLDITILNPRRKNFPIQNPQASREQIRWEFEHLRKADIVIFWFPKESICPIALYELGAWCMTDKPICLGVAPEYERKLDIEEQTALVRPEIEIVCSLKELAEQIADLIKHPSGNNVVENKACNTNIECESPAVHSYLNILQSVITRMASNSSGCKSWCITLVSAITVILIDRDKAQYVYIGLAPITLFGLLDCYYLTMENLFRDRYNGFIRKLHSDNVQRSDLFVVSPQQGVTSILLLKNLRSISIYPFYLVFALIVVAIGLVSSYLID